MTWLRWHGSWTPSNSLITSTILQLGNPHTIKRFIFGWRMSILCSDSVNNQIAVARTYAGFYTKRSDNAATIDPSALPASTINPPTERWICLENRMLIASGAHKGFRGGPETSWCDTGPENQEESFGQILAPGYSGGVSLNVYFTAKSTGLPSVGIVSSFGLYYCNVLYV